MSFRIAIGNCSCKSPNLKQGGSVAHICESVMAKLQMIKNLSFEQINAMPTEEEELAWVESKRVQFITIKERKSDNSILVVVRAFMFSWRWPTFISLSGVGHAVAEGVLVKPDGHMEDANEDDLWFYR